MTKTEYYVILEVRDDLGRELYAPDAKFGYCVEYAVLNHALYLTREAAQRDADNSEKWQREMNLHPGFTCVVAKVTL